MKPFVLSLALAAGVAAPAFAAPKMDGAFPMYPNAHLDSRESGVPDAAIAKGVPLVLLTSDPVATVDAWYKSRLPAGCKRNAAPQGVQYTCPGGSLQIYDHAGTQIAIVPSLSF